VPSHLATNLARFTNPIRALAERDGGLDPEDRTNCAASIGPSQTTSIGTTARVRTGDIGRADVHQSEAGAAGALCSTSGRDDGAGS
jgi:hypothetical protein